MAMVGKYHRQGFGGRGHLREEVSHVSIHVNHPFSSHFVSSVEMHVYDTSGLAFPSLFKVIYIFFM